MTIEDSRRTATIGRAATAVGLLMFGALAAGCSQSKADEAAGNFSSDPDRAKIERIVRDYVISHPEIIEQAFEHRESLAKAKLVDQHRKDLETPFAGGWAGARDGDVVLVEFFDYACTFCKASNADITRLLAEDKNLKVVWREFPVLGPDSQTAAEASLAASKQGRFRQFHDKMFEEGQPNPVAIAKVQKATGVTPLQLAEFSQEISKNNALARDLGATGTPTFVVGDKVLDGAVGYEKLKEAIAEARKKA